MNGKTILVVEDDATICELVSLILEDYKYEVTTAATLADAVARLQDGLPDAVVLDLGLPDGDGAAIVELLRPSGALSRVPVVVLTARRCVGNLDVAAVLSKPFDLDDLLVAVHRVVTDPWVAGCA